MKTKKTIPGLFAALLILVLSFSTSKSFGQEKTDDGKNDGMMKNCCMMKDGKMVCMKDGKSTPMEKEMTMKNGTKCMPNGECVMKDGSTMTMKEGECMDMSGKLCKCDKKHKKEKEKVEKKPMN